MSEIRNELSLTRVINASGKMTILGGSKLSEAVTEAMCDGSQNFYVMSDLMMKSRQWIEMNYNVEAAWIVSSASSGIAQTVAAAIAQDNLDVILNPYAPNVTKRNIVIAKGHIVDYGTSIEVPIRMGGGTIIEAGFANACSKAHFESKITDDTAALLYVKSHHAVQKGMLELEEVVELGKKYKVPVIVDAAAESDLNLYLNKGADAVIYSGTKALEGPTSGVVVGKATFIDVLKLQGQGIGRVMKVGKESIFGLMAALLHFKKRQPATKAMQEAFMAPLLARMNALDGVRAVSVQDGAGRPIYRASITFTHAKDAMQMTKALQESDPKIYTRDYRKNEGIIEVDLRDVSETELEEIAQAIETLYGGLKK